MHSAAPQSDPDVNTPQRVEAMGLSRTLMEDILLRRAVLEGRTPMTTFSDKLHVSLNVIEALTTDLRRRKLLEYDGLDGRVYLVVPTEAGREHALHRSRECNYAGPMPVGLDHYTAVVRAQRPTVNMDSERLTASFSDLVISPELLDNLGPAIHGSGAIFLYGPPGTGKSSIAERIVRAYEDLILVPHAIAVDGQIVTVFDPTVHEPADVQPVGIDRRFVACRRPAVVAGGELHAAMLDLQRDGDTGVYLAPLQLKANNGVLVIDDFGRQTMSPEALLNRWIVPLDRAVDYLTMQGRKIETPFEVKTVLSTNLSPKDLGDEAFFRRIHNKIYVGALNDDQFDWVLVRVAPKHRVEVDAGVAALLRSEARRRGDGELRAYLPGVVCSLARSIMAYDGLGPKLTPELVERVLDLYFTRMDEDPPKPPFLAHQDDRTPAAQDPEAFMGLVADQAFGTVDQAVGTTDQALAAAGSAVETAEPA